VLTGRQDELALLTDRLAAGRATAVLGEAGVGKTALLQAAAAATGRPVLITGGFATLSWLAYLPLRPVLGWPVPAGDEARLAAEVEAAVGGGVLILDDLHWCDPQTRALLPLLTGRIRLLTAVRQRDPAAAATLAELAAAGIEVIPLVPLAAESAAELARAVRPDLPAATVAALTRRAGGNPLLIRELAATGEPSASLRLALAAQLRGVPAAVREAFALVSLVGHPVPADRFAELAGTGLVTVADGQLAVRHALLAEETVAGLAPDERRRLHARAAGLVTAPGEVARHLAAAGDRAAAGRLARQAAADAALPGERAAHLGLAAECADGPDADALRLAAATALAEAGADAAAKAALDGVTGADPVVRVPALLLRTQLDWATGDSSGARAALAAAERLVDSGSALTTRVELRLAQARVAAFADGAYDRAVELAADALALAESASPAPDEATPEAANATPDEVLPMTGRRAPGETTPGGLRPGRVPPGAVARAHYLLGTALCQAGRDGWAEHLDAARRAAAGLGDQDVEFRAANNLIGAHEMTGDHGTAAELAVVMVGRAGELGLVAWERQFLAMRANLDMLAGRYGSALAAAERLLAAPVEPRTRDQVEVTYCHALIDQGRFEQAREQIDRSLRTAAPDAVGRTQFAYLAAEIDLWSGRLRPAAAALAALLDSVGPEHEITVFARLALARVAAELGEDPGELLLPHPLAFFASAPVEVAGLRQLVRGDHTAAAATLDRAAAGWAPYHRRDALYCRWRAGEALRLAGDLAGARSRLVEVEEAATAGGMAPLLGRAQRSLRLAGERRTAPRRPGAGPLTGGERDVLLLVRSGLTNAEIAVRLGRSRRTVETQLASAATKLGVTGRVQAAALLDEP
jgi:DNA-binding CsgD family transcriptional regulator/tetratricopeptide (TPR) repeat protein